MADDVILQYHAYGSLFDADDEVPPSIERDQPRTRNSGRSKQSVVVKLQGVVCGMENDRRCSDRGNPLIRQYRLVVEFSAGGPRRNRVHEINNLVGQFPLRWRKTGNDGGACTH